MLYALIRSFKIATNNKGRNRNELAGRRPLFEALELRRMLAGNLVRISPSIYDAYARADVEAVAWRGGGANPFDELSGVDFDENFARTDVAATAATDWSNADATAAATARIADGGRRARVAAAGVNGSNAAANGVSSTADGSGYTPLTSAYAQYEYVNPAFGETEEFRGSMILAAFTGGAAGVVEDGPNGHEGYWQNNINISIIVSLNGNMIRSLVLDGDASGNQDGSSINWTSWGEIGVPGAREDGAPGLQLDFVIPDLDDGDRIEFDVNVLVNGSSSALAFGAGSAWANQQTAGFGMVTGELFTLDTAPPDFPVIGVIELPPLQEPGYGPFVQGISDFIHSEPGTSSWDAFGDALDARAGGNGLIVTIDANESDAGYDFEDLSLREALLLAADVNHPGTDTIVIAPWVGTIELDGTALSITSDVIISGPGADKLTIDANALSRVFSVDGGVTAEISGLTITGGFVYGTGGGVLNSGNLTLENVSVVGNSAYGAGGGIYVVGGGSLTVLGSELKNNSAYSGGGAIVAGLGSNLQVEDTWFHGNSASGTSGAYGGAILAYVGVGNLFSIYNSTLNANSAVAGGALAIYGHGTTIAPMVARIENSTFSGNTASAGGAIALERVAGTLTDVKIVNATVAYNTATHSSAGGGGIYNSNGVSVTVQNSIIAENTAANTSTHDVWGSLVGDGTSRHNIIGQAGTSGLTHNPTVTGNKVGTSTRINPLLAPLGDYGGKTKTHALLVGSPALDAGSDALATAFDQRGYDRDQDQPDVGDGIGGTSDIGAYEAGEGTTLIVRSDGDRNDSIGLKATTDSLRLREALALSAALAGTEVISFDRSGWGDSKIDLSSTWGELFIQDDVEINGGAGELLTIDAQQNSRVIHIGEDISNVTLRGLRITGGLISGGGLASGGGILYSKELTSGGVITLDECQVDNNSAHSGGGMYVYGGTLIVRNSTFSANTASNNGGGVMVSHVDSATFLNTTFSGNVSGGEGGGLHNRLGTDVRVIHGTIYGNTAVDGGGIFTAPYLGTRLDNTIVAGNTASSSSDLSGPIDSLSRYNLIGFDSSIGNGIDDGVNGNMVGGEGSDPAIDARLKALGDYGGRTKTHALYYDSLAIETGDNDVAEDWELEFDQRGNGRVVDWDQDLDSRVDIGAFELAIGELYS